MNKLLEKMMKKWKLVSLICGAIIGLGIIIGSIFGFNVAPTASDANNFVVRLESYPENPVVEKIEDICEDVFEDKGISYKYSHVVEYASGKIHEYVYVFTDSTSIASLNKVKVAVDEAIATEKANQESALYGAFIYVNVSEGKAISTMVGDYVWRVILAGVVFLIGAFTYSAIRHGVFNGIFTIGATFAAFAIHFAIVLLARIPVTATVAYSFAFTALLTAGLASLFAGNVKKLSKTPGNEEKSFTDLALEGLDAKNVGIFACALLIGLILVGAIAITPVSWLAVSAVVGLVCSALVYFLILPAIFVFVSEKRKEIAKIKSKYNYKKESK